MIIGQTIKGEGTHKGRPRESLTPVFEYKLPNAPGKSMMGVIIDYEPYGSTPPHRHGTASVTGYVLQGTVRSAMNDDPAREYGPGENWFERPGCHHKMSENPSTTEPARLLAVFVVDSDFKFEDVMILDPGYEQ